MATAATIRAISSRLETEVERHGCGREACDLCTDREECIAVAPTRPAAARLPVQAVDVPEPSETLAVVFGGELACY